MGGIGGAANLIGYATTLSALNDLKDSLDAEETWVVGTNVEYSVHVEYGTEDMAAQPYLRPAVREAVREIEADDYDDVDSLVEGLAMTIEAKAKDKVPVDTGNLKRSIEAEKR